MPADIHTLTPGEIAPANWPPICSNCGATEVRVLESRPNRNAIRRRKHCSSCGHRETTYEIAQAQYKELEVLARLRKVLSGNEPAPIALLCQDCSNWADRSCSFGFPEAGGRFATDCSVFDPATPEQA
jgi:hypothetical protein